MKPDSSRFKGKLNLPKPNIPEQKNKFHISGEVLEQLRERVNEKITFSFNFFDRETDLFNLGSTGGRSIAVCGEWFITLLDSLKEVSKLTKQELVAQRQHYDFHGHEWERVTRKYKLDEDFLEQVDCVQFRLTVSKGRVHGFMVGNRFYVIWLDPHHNLYPDERFGGEKYYMKTETCFEKLGQELARLYKENSRLRRENDELMELLEVQTS